MTVLRDLAVLSCKFEGWSHSGPTNTPPGTVRVSVTSGWFRGYWVRKKAAQMLLFSPLSSDSPHLAQINFSMS